MVRINFTKRIQLAAQGKENFGVGWRKLLPGKPSDGTSAGLHWATSVVSQRYVKYFQAFSIVISC
jgi:hypothetical protein